MVGLWIALTANAGRYAMDANHPEWRWKTIDTEHFSIHYPVSRKSPDHRRHLSGERSAQRLAAIADDTWTRLCTEIGNFPRERVHITVLEDSDRLTGFTLVQQNWIVMSGNPGPELARMRGQVDWVEDLLAHELAHVITLKKSGWMAEAPESFGVETGGLIEDGANQIGAQLSLGSTEPHWFSEGAAEFWSERIGVNRWTPGRENTLIASVLDDRWLDQRDWDEETPLDAWYDSERAYQQGYAFHRWLADTYGDRAWRDIMERSSKRFHPHWSTIVEDVTGVPFDALFERFTEDTRARAEARVATVEASGPARGRELAMWEQRWERKSLRGQDRWARTPAEEREQSRLRTGTLHLYNKYSDDSTWFARQRGGWIEVKAVDEAMWTAFSEVTPDFDTTAEQRKRSLDLSVWLPSRYMAGFDFVPGEDALVMVGWEGADRLKVTPQRYEWTQLYLADLTPDIDKQPGKSGPVEAERFEEGTQRRLTAIPGTLRAHGPSVSPDGEWVAYAQYFDGAANLMVSRIDGSDKRRLTDFEDAWVVHTDWTTDGAHVVFSMHRDHQQNLWQVDVETGSLESITADQWEETDPHVAKDGSLWFAADVDGRFDVYRLKDDRVHRMTSEWTGAYAPWVTPDGNLLYTAFTGFGWKAMGLQRTRLRWAESDAFVLAQPAVERTPSPAPRLGRPYRSLRSVTGLAMSPVLRIDRQDGGAVLPRLGAYLKLRDAAENHTWTANAWLGGDAYAWGAWDWHGLWPDLRVSGSHWVGPAGPDRRALTSGSAKLTLPWSDDFQLAVTALGFTFRDLSADRPILRSGVVSLSTTIGDSSALRRDTARGTVFRAFASRGASDGELAYVYHRVEGSFDGVYSAQTGDDHRWIVSLAGGLTDRAVHPEDGLWLGGDHPYALRPGRVQSTMSMPGYAPFALHGQHAGVAGLAWRAPLAQDLRSDFGPVRVNALFFQIGGHGAGVIGPQTGVLADAVAEVRVHSTLFDARWNSIFRMAYGARTPTGLGGPRFVLGLGTGF